MPRKYTIERGAYTGLPLTLPPEQHDRILDDGTVVLVPPIHKTLTQRYYERVLYNPQGFSDIVYIDAVNYLIEKDGWTPVEKLCWLCWQLGSLNKSSRQDYRSSQLDDLYSC